ncbi:MAG: patatin-like phospholipase family protein, partial [Gemmiger sp.]
ENRPAHRSARATVPRTVAQAAGESPMVHQKPGVPRHILRNFSDVFGFALIFAHRAFIIRQYHKEDRMKTGIVDVGGGLRGVYAAGVFDYCLDAGIHFDVGIGVSAGSANVISYIAGQKRRNYSFYTDYPFRKEYMSLRNLALKNLIWIWTISTGR